MPDDFALRRARLLLDRADDAYVHATEVGSERSELWREVVADAAALAATAESAGNSAGNSAENTVVSDAESALAQAILAQADTLPTEPAHDGRAMHGRNLRLAQSAVGAAVQLCRSVSVEVAHVARDRPRSVLVRLALTVAIGLGLVVSYQLIGWASYDAKSLTIYLFSAVAGSVVCTNALCFEARRVQQSMAAGRPLWRILVVKNLTIGLLIVVAAIPVIALLSVGDEHPNPLVIIDQLVAMLFIWLGVANVLSVISPLRRESLTARLKDGTWLPFLLSFGISYGVGLVVNIMIYWRLWARQAASSEITGGAWSAFALVLVSSIMTWVLLTVLAVAAAQHPVVRRTLIREIR